MSQRIKQLTIDMIDFQIKMIYGKTFYEKKKLVKCFTFFKSVRHFTEKWLNFQLTRKMFSVDHLFFAKQTPENTENIFL